jgi:hypothetical protein
MKKPSRKEQQTPGQEEYPWKWKTSFEIYIRFSKTTTEARFILQDERALGLALALAVRG